MTDSPPISSELDEGSSSSTDPLETELAAKTGEHPVLFFDGVCGLCNRSIDFFLAHDNAGRFRYAPLQGETARKLLKSEERESLQTVVLVNERGSYRRSAAIVRILWGIGGFWKLVGWFLWIIPLPIRDVGYRLISRYRYRLFGKKESCRMPTADEREQFLP